MKPLIYLVDNGDRTVIRVIEPGADKATEHEFPINVLGLARLARECSEAVHRRIMAATVDPQ